MKNELTRRCFIALMAGSVATMSLACAPSEGTSPEASVPRNEALTNAPIIEVVRIDDEFDAFADVQDTTRLREQRIEIFAETAPGRDGQPRTNHFARMNLRQGETIAAAKARVQPWLDSIKIPPETRLGLMDLHDYNHDTSETTPAGLRTVVLRGPAILSSADISQASVEQNEGREFVSITLSPDAARRFEEATAEWQKRRMGIVIDGMVHSAPIIQSKIAGGRLSVTMSSTKPAERRAQATQLAARLNAQAKGTGSPPR